MTDAGPMMEPSKDADSKKKMESSKDATPIAK